MKLSLTPELELFLRQRAGTERYPTAEAVVAEAIGALQRQEAEEAAKVEELRRSLKEAEAAVDRGEYIEAKDMTVERIREGAIRRFGQPGQRTRA